MAPATKSRPARLRATRLTLAERMVAPASAGSPPAPRGSGTSTSRQLRPRCPFPKLRGVSCRSFHWPSFPRVGVSGKPGAVHLERLAVHTRRSAVRTAQPMGMGHDVFSAHLVVEHVEPKLRFCLRFRMQRLSQLLDLQRRLQSHRQSPLRSLLPAPVPDQGPFAPPALPGFLTTTGLSATPSSPALSSRTTDSPDTPPGLPTGLPVLRRSPVCMHAIATTPAGALGARVVRIPQRRRPSPYLRRVGSCITLFEACSAFTARYRLHARRVPEGPSTLEASAASLPPRPSQLLPAGTTVAGWDSHPLRERAFHGALRFPR